MAHRPAPDIYDYDGSYRPPRRRAVRSRNTASDGVPRRDFLYGAAKVALIAAGVTTLSGVIQLPLSKMGAGFSEQFRVGFPGHFAINSVVMAPERNVFIIRDTTDFRAMSAVCTHLGCVVEQTETGFSCPCHGSEFDVDGKLLGGPAPRPLDWFRMSLAPDGQLVVDTGRTVDEDHVLHV
ncbi:ubiquinol-cytochrome c reductase iron-sulfur subunit [Candidatus Poribacteria bacterium]|nr:ubiquinol-cytochrome c reductase iron-sulfur subunit [Candidatus Poribacteria bacterium]